MSTKHNVLIMGASYGSLLASKLMPEGNIPVSQTYDADGRVITQIVGSTLTNRFE